MCNCVHVHLVSGYSVASISRPSPSFPYGGSKVTLQFVRVEGESLEIEARYSVHVNKCSHVQLCTCIDIQCICNFPLRVVSACTRTCIYMYIVPVYTCIVDGG